MDLLQIYHQLELFTTVFHLVIRVVMVVSIQMVQMMCYETSMMSNVMTVDIVKMEQLVTTLMVVYESVVMDLNVNLVVVTDVV